MKKISSLTIAIPAYNEAESIENVVTEAIKVADEILVVNDGSTDKTADILKKFPTIRVITHPKNQGFSGAIKSCYKSATKDLVFLLPADGQIQASDCKLFLERINDSDVVVGFRKNNPEPFTRKLNSFVFHSMYRMLFGVKLKEISTSILWRKKVLDSINITAIPRSALIEPEVVYKAWAHGWRFAEVPIPYYPRAAGKAKGANPLMIFITIKELFRLWLNERVRGKKVRFLQ